MPLITSAGTDQISNEVSLKAIYRERGELFGCRSVRYTQCMTTLLAIGVPDDLVCRLDALIAGKHSTRSEAIRRAIELYLYRLAYEHDAQQYERLPLTDSEFALADDQESWSETPAW